MASTSEQQQQHATQVWTALSQITLAPAASVATAAEFRVETFTQTNVTFPQRFWLNSRHYKPRLCAPVIVIDGGERGRPLPFPGNGHCCIADILAARTTGGIGVVLEHRYYGAFLLHVYMRYI
jgi:hypothetical protein